ncbi:cupin domain-containing protein [Pontibacter sp. Tf4]|uniref:cupin domain-containing protein n=1 Tax=Pontibacter sp. Tf4 TaxID=2761620 RepID=UPI001629ED18|nr:cupin domain-containing protein [Pontibacter sp. Tf4]MBB6612662.1 cupin domain-containing protein [Pontibacter sp. Tf4]
MLPKTIYNPLAKDKVTFLASGEETGGAYELVEVELAPGGGVGLHYHTNLAEEFEPVRGILGIELDGRQLQVHPGQMAVAPVNSLHRFYNPSPTETILFRTYIRPARNFEKTLRIAYGLVNDGKTNNKGIPASIWHMALLFTYGESYLPGIPLLLQKKIFGFLAWLATRLGKHRELEKYWIGEKVKIKVKADLN